MLAMYSAQAGLIVFPRQSEFIVEDIYTGERTESSRAALRFTFNGCTDVQSGEFKREIDARSAARIPWATSRALSLLLYLIDPEDQFDDHEEVASFLQEMLLIHSSIASRVANILFAKPLPKAINSTRMDAYFSGDSDISVTIHRLEASQPQVTRVREAFDGIPEDLFGQTGRVAFEAEAIERGCFRTLVLAAADGLPMGKAIFEVHTSLNKLENARGVIQAWTKQYQVSLKLRNTEDIPNTDQVRQPFNFDGAGARRRALERVQREKRAILDRVATGDLETARSFARELVSNQEREGEPEHVAKSLTSLSRDARDLGAWSVALEWAEQAVKIKVDDPKTHAELAQGYLHYGRYSDAVSSLDLAEAFGEGAFAVTQRARILRLQRLPDAALTAYEEALDRFSGTEQEPYIIAGVAESLRDMGRLEESKDLYADASRRFDQHAGILNGFASVLRELGSHDEALGVFKNSVRMFGDAVARNGIAQIYRDKGEFEAAKELFEETIVQFPYDTYSRCGLTYTLLDKDDATSALSLAARTAAMFTESSAALSAYGATLQRTGRITDAAELYRDGLGRFPFDPHLSISLSNLERHQGNYDEALIVLDRARERFPYDRSIESARAGMLRRLGRVEEAVKAYRAILDKTRHSRFASNSLASLFVYVGRYDEALALLQVDDPYTEAEWRTFMLRAHLDHRTGFTNDAIRRLQYGIQNVPFAREDRMMRATLASLALEANDITHAVSLTATLKGDFTALLKLHALASSNKLPQANAMLVDAEMQALPPKYLLIRDEIVRHFGIEAAPPRHDLPWLFKAENDALLLEAA